jgi:hypothetical protein
MVTVTVTVMVMVVGGHTLNLAQEPRGCELLPDEQIEIQNQSPKMKSKRLQQGHALEGAQPGFPPLQRRGGVIFIAAGRGTSRFVVRLLPVLKMWRCGPLPFASSTSPGPATSSTSPSSGRFGCGSRNLPTLLVHHQHLIICAKK